MALALASPEDVINAALKRFGYRLQVGSIYEGSLAAKMALDIYAQTRDALLREGDGASDWGFAQRAVSLTLLKQAPNGGYVPPTTWNPATHPQMPWYFEYEYPGDCLKLKSIRPNLFGVLNFDPQPYTYNIANDNAYNPARKVILCNVQNAIMTYVGQVTDPLTWEAGFVDAFSAALAKMLAPVLANLEAAKVAMVDEQAEKQTAVTLQG